MSVLQPTASGLYCPAGGFYIDPWRPVQEAVITHAHSDHARHGMGRYTCSASCEPLLRLRVGAKANLRALPFGEPIDFGRARVTLFPAGHILGSAQVRVEVAGEVWVVTGDHNATHAHGAAEPFVSVPCDCLITESTFGLPIYRWPEPARVMDEIHAWWRDNQAHGRTSILPCYPLGKSQRILQALDSAIGPIAMADAASAFLPHYRAAGIALPETLRLLGENAAAVRGRGLVIVSMAGEQPGLLRRLQPLSYGAASGWLQVRGARRQQGFDTGFVLSDHSDWDGLLHVVRACGARRVGVTHGQVDAFARYLREVEGLDSFVVPTHFESAGN